MRPQAARLMRLVLGGLLLVLLGITGVRWGNHLAEDAAIRRVNRQTDLAGLYLTMPLPSPHPTSVGGFPELGGCFGCERYASEADGVVVLFGGYPDEVNHAVLKDVTLTQPRFAVAGVRVGDPIEQAEATLIRNGLGKTAVSDTQLRFSRGRLYVVLRHTGGVVAEIHAGLSSTNKSGIVY